MSLFVKGMDEAYGNEPMAIGENGTFEYAAHQVGDALVAFFFALVRNIPEERLKSLFRDCIQQVQLPHITGGDKTRMIADLFILAFQTRDCRGGKGERQLFYKLFIELYGSYPQTVLSCLPLLAEYGYYKDYFNILAEIGLNSQFSGLKNRIFDILVNQLIADEAAIDTYEEKQHLKAEAKAEGSSSTSKMGGGPSVSLCGKYCPRESNHWQEANKELFREFLSRLFPENADATRGKILYRKLIVKLTAAIDVPEVKMCGKRFAEIEIPKIPSVCMKKNRKAFANEKLKGALKPSETETGNRSTEEDRILCRKHLMEALKNKKIKGKQNFPHEIVHLLMDHRKHPSAVELEIFQNQWEAIRNDIVEQMAKKAADGNTAGVNLGKLVPLVDVSGSMAGTPMEVAIALGILISELNHPSFRNRFITFETNPSWCDLSRATTIDQKVNIAKAASWGGSTDIEKAFDLIAAVVEKNRLPSSEIPSLIIFSDMQFDVAVGAGAKQTQLARIKTRFANLGNKLYGEPLPAPTIIFWNLRGNTSGFPAQANSDNVQMLSGFSPSLFKHVVDGTDLKEDEKPNPYDTFRKAMDDERYNNVRKILNDSQEGFLAQYSFIAEKK